MYKNILIKNKMVKKNTTTEMIKKKEFRKNIILYNLNESFYFIIFRRLKKNLNWFPLSCFKFLPINI